MSRAGLRLCVAGFCGRATPRHPSEWAVWSALSSVVGPASAWWLITKSSQAVMEHELNDVGPVQILTDVHVRGRISKFGEVHQVPTLAGHALEYRQASSFSLSAALWAAGEAACPWPAQVARPSDGIYKCKSACRLPFCFGWCLYTQSAFSWKTVQGQGLVLKSIVETCWNEWNSAGSCGSEGVFPRPSDLSNVPAEAKISKGIKTPVTWMVKISSWEGGIVIF